MRNLLFVVTATKSRDELKMPEVYANLGGDFLDKAFRRNEIFEEI